MCFCKHTKIQSSERKGKNSYQEMDRKLLLGTEENSVASFCN